MGIFFNKKPIFEEIEIENILEDSKIENKKYLNEILSIDKISAFDATLIMSKLELTQEKIELLKSILKKYENYRKDSDTESYSTFLFGVVENMENMEKLNKNLKEELAKCKNDFYNVSSFVDNLISQSALILNYSFNDKKQEFVFSKIYIDD